MSIYLRFLVLAICLLATSAYASKQDELDNLRSRITRLQQELEKHISLFKSCIDYFNPNGTETEAIEDQRYYF